MAKTKRYNSGPSAEDLKKQWGSDTGKTKQTTRSIRDIKSQWDGTAEKDRQTEQVRLKREKEALDSFSGPQYQGAAQRAAYYQRELGYNAKYGDRASYDASNAAYQDALNAANSAYDLENKLRNGQYAMQDMLRGANPFRKLTSVRSAEQDLARQAGRLSSDAVFYQQMAQDAAAMGSQELFNRAQSGLEQTGRNYGSAYERYLRAGEEGRRAQAEQLKSSNRGEYFGATLSREQIEGQLRQLEQRKAQAEQELSAAYAAWRVGSQHGEEEAYNAREKALQDIEDEIATYNSALGYRKSYDYNDIRQQFTDAAGKLTADRMASRDKGRQMYEADRTKALREGGLNTDLGDDLSSGRGAHIRYRDSIRDAGYFDTFEDAQHLNEEDRDIFYALYAEDPEKAREWMTIAKTERDEQYQSYLSRLVDLRAGEHLGTAGKLADIGAVGAGFVLGTGSNIAAGVINLIDPYSETALELSRAGQAFLAGGSKMLNREFGTFDEKVPFIGNILGGKGLGDLYTLASSVVQSHLTAGVAAHAGELSNAVQALGVIIMGSGAAASDYDESLKRGLTERQARQHAFAAGLNEAAFEWISLDKLVNPDFGASAIKQWLTQSGIEASEEFCTTIANRLTDGMLARRNGYDTQIEQRMKELIALGVDHNEAKERAEHEWTTDLINDALGGFLSGGAGQMMNSVTGYALSKYGDVADRMRFENDQTRRLEQSGAAITSQEELQALQSYAKANNISFDQAAEAKLSEAGTEASEQNGKPTRKEKRQQAKSNRSAGAVQEQVVRSIADSIQKRGLDQAQTIYDETVSQHGQGIARQAAAAVSRAASEQLGKLNNSAELEQAYKAASAGVTEPAVRKAIDQAYNIQSYAIAQRTGNEEAVERIQQRVRNTSASGKRNLSLDVQVTNEDGSTSTAQITGVTANAAQVKLSNGQTVDVDQLTGIDADTKDVLDRIQYMEVGPAANLMWNAYQLEVKNGTMQDGYRWIMDYTVAFDQGRQGSVTQEQAVGRAEGLSPQIAEMAYQQGREVAKQMTDEQKADLKKRMSITTKGATGRAGTVNTDAIANMRLSEAQKKQLDIVKRIAEVFGIDVEVFASGTKNVTVNGKKMQAFQGENGSYENGRIRLDINAGLNYIGDIGSGLVATMGHELTHFIQEFAPEEYRAYKEFVLATIARTEGSQALERLIQEKIDRSKNGLSRTAAEDEVVADAAQTVLTDSQAIQQMAEQEPTLFEKVLQWIKDFFNEIRDALAGSPRMSEEARLFRGLEAEVRKAFGELWDKGITEAVRVHDQVGSTKKTAQEGGEQLSLREAEKIGYDKLIDQYYNGTLRRANPIYIGSFSSVTGTLFGSTAPLIITGSDLTKSTRPDKGNSRSAHALSEPFVRSLPQKINKAQFGYTETRNGVPSFTIVVQDEKSGKLYAVGGALNAQYENRPVNRVLSVFEIGTPEQFLIKEGKALVSKNMNTAKTILEKAGIQSPALQNILDRMRIVSQRGRNVNGQNSDRDTEYLELAKDPEKNQARLQEMVDEAAKAAGYTIKAYHGTTEDFTEFSRRNQGQNHKGYLEFGAGFYFTPSEKEARIWAERGKNGPARAKDSKVMAVYLNPGRIIEADAPIPGGTEYLQSMGLTKADAAFVANRTYRFINYMLEDKGYSNVEVQDQLKAMGFDAVEDTYRNRTEGQYVVFDPEQIKSADPVTYDDKHKPIPLSERFNDANRDIRYSERSAETYTNREAEKEHYGAESAADSVRFSLRTEQPPTKTQGVYKLMRLGKDGNLYPLFIDSASGIEVGKWYDADSPDFRFLQKMPEGVFLVDTDTQTYTTLEDYQKEHGDTRKRKLPTREWVDEATRTGKRWMTIEPSEKSVSRYGGETRRYYNVGINGSGSVSTFALRPGWHAGSLPTMRQIGKGANKNLRDDTFVWVQGRVPADIDYQAEAERNVDKDIPTKIPKNGYYLKATNANATASQADRVGWYVAGSFIADRIMGDAETREVIDRWNAAHPNDEPVEYDYDRESGKVFNAETMQLEEREAGQARFSMREPVETADRLIAWHNMNEDALRSALELGGLAMPSWAIKTADQAHTSYGKISVIAPRELVDPKLNRSSMIFGGDAWTPVFPDIDYDVSFEAAEDLYNEITGLIGENVMRELGGASIDTQNIAQQLSNNGGAVSNYYKNNVALRYAYLKSIGKDINVPRREVRLDQSGQYDNQAVQMFAERLVNGKRSLQYFRSMTGREVMQQEDLKKAISDVMVARHGEEVRDLYAPDELSFRNIEAMLSAANRFFENGGDVPSETDRYALAKEIDKVIDEAAYEKWIGEKLNKTVTKKGVYNGKDPFTPSGNRRSFDALHYAYNLANIVKAMKSQPKQGRTQFLSGPGSVKGAALKSYNTVEQVRKDRSRLVNSAEEGQAAYDAYNRNLEDILDRMSKNGDRFDAADALIEVFQHAKTETAIYSYMQRELKDWYNISRELAHDAYELIGQINALPMEYFEGKTYDAVRFDETAAVVVPDNIDPAIKQQLEDAGARVVEYKAGDDADRLEKVNSVEEAKFSERDYSAPSDLELMDNAAQYLSEAGGEEYWNALLESVPELASDKAELRSMAKAYREQAKKLAEAEKNLADAKRNLTTTDRKLRTRGIAGMTLEIMKSLEAGDAKNRHVAKHVAEIITKAYQKGLDAIDAGKNAGEVWDVVWNEGVEKAADYLLENATHSEKFSYGWTTSFLNKYMPGEDGRWAVLDAISAKVVQDWNQNRMREPIQETAADRIVQRVEGRMQKQINEQTERADTAEAKVNRLQEDVNIWKDAQVKASDAARRLQERLDEVKAELKQAKGLTAKEQKAKRDQALRLNNRLQAKRQEAAAWKKLAERNEALLNAALKSKNADIDALRVQMDRNATEAAKKQAALVKKLNDQVEREKKILEGKLKPPAMQRLLKAERERAAKEAEQHKDEVFRNYKERQRQGDLRNRIKNIRSELANRIAKPSDRVYVPAALAQSLVDVLDTLDASPRDGTKAAAKYASVSESLRELAKAYGQLSLEKQNEIPWEFKSEYQEEITKAIEDLETAMQGRNLRELSADELQQVYDVVKRIRDTLRDATKMIGTNRHASIYDAGESVIANQRYIKALKNDKSKAGRSLNRMMSSIQIDALSAMRAAMMMGGFSENAEIYQLMKDIEDGYADKNRITMEAAKRFQDLRSGKNAEEYLKAIRELHDYGIKDTEGRTVKLTKMQAMQILMTWQREQANDRLVHMTDGGIIVRDADLVSKGKFDAAEQAQQTVKVTPEMIAKINSEMTEWDKAYMQAARDTFDSLLKQSNDVLYALKKKVHKGEKNYIPERVAGNYLQQEVVKGGEFNLGVKEAGATKDLVQRSTLPIIIDGLETLLNHHVNEMANYIGMAVPIRNFAKVYNMRTTGIGVDATTVNAEIAKTWGKKAGDMLMDTLREIQNGRTYQYNTAFNKAMDKLQNAFVKASLVGKISVTIKQAASYAAAGSVISQRSLDASQQYIAALLLAPNSKMAQNLYKRMDARTPEYWIRRQGLSMEEIAIDKNRRGLIRDKADQAGAWLEGKGKVGQFARRNLTLLNPTNWIQRVDVATTGALAIACEKQARYDGYKPGTAEYEAHVTELYERVIRETQPMYDALHRPEFQKNAPMLLKMTMPFRTVPFQNYGQIMVAAGQFQAAQRDGTKAEKTAAAKHLGKTLWANFESAAIFAFLTLLTNALMHKPKKYLDDDEELTLESILKSYGSDVLDVSLGNLMPYGGTELKDLVERWINGDKWYDVLSVGAVDLVNSTVKSILSLHTAGDKFREGEIDATDMKNTFLNTLMQVTKMMGLPVSNLKDIYSGISADVNDLAQGKLSIDRSNAVNAQRYYKAWQAGDAAKMQTVMDELKASTGDDADKIRNAVNGAFKTAYETDEISLDEYTSFIQQSSLFDAEKQKNKVRDLAKAAVENGEMDEDAAIAYLTGTGLYDEDEAWKKVMEWKAKAEHAGDEDYSWNQYEALRDAFETGTGIDEAVRELKDHGYTEKQLSDEISDNVRKTLTSGGISEAQAISYLEKYLGKDEDAAWKTVKKWAVSAEHGDDEDFSYSQYTELYEAIDANKDVKSIVSGLTAHGVDAANVNDAAKKHLVERYENGQVTETQFRNQLSRYCKIVGETADKLVRNANVKKATGYSWDELDNAYRDGNVSATAAKQALTKYGNLSTADANARIRYWDFKKAYPDSTMEQETVDKFYNSDTLRSSGLTLDNYVQYYTKASKATGTDKNGDGRTDSGSLKAAKMKIIDSLNITRVQKDALYYFNGWSAKTIWEAPWH